MIIQDPEFGEIVIHIDKRIRRLSIRIKDGVLYTVVPPFVDVAEVPAFINRHRRRLRTMMQRSSERPQATTVELAQLRKAAKDYLPGRLQQLALQYGFSFTSVRVRNTHTRWGSCSILRSISLSVSLMTLPSHLIDYVLLHELCHTKVMNHGPHFYKLLDSVTGNKAHELSRELAKFSTIQSSK